MMYATVNLVIFRSKLFDKNVTQIIKKNLTEI